MSSRRKRVLLILGVSLLLSSLFLLVDVLLHALTRVPWPDLPSLTMAVLVLVSSSIILTVHHYTEGERVTAREILASREESYRTLFDMFPEATTVWSRDGVLLMQNLVSARHLGGKREDFLGKRVVEIFGPAAGAAYLERLQQVFDTGVLDEREDMLVLADGPHTFRTYMQRIRQPGGKDAIQVIAYDITQRAEAEAAFRAEHERALVYLNVAATLFVAIDLEGRVTLINAKACQVLGRDESEIIGQNWFANFVPPAEREQARADFQRLLSAANMTESFRESTILTSCGEERLIAWHGVVLRDDAGRPLGTLRSGEDITERRHAEKALRASEMLRIQERSALAERQRLARELHDSVSQALYGIALGVNTALTVLDRDREAAQRALNYSIALARAGLSEMRALIFELRPESLQSEGLAAALRKQAEAANARFEIPINIDICDEPDLPLASKEALYRIALEALHNAVKHAGAQEISVRLTCSDTCWTLTVRDDGVGFDMAAVQPGHLGLKSMQERAASVNGVLSITSAPGAGTVVEAQAPLGGSTGEGGPALVP